VNLSKRNAPNAYGKLFVLSPAFVGSRWRHSSLDYRRVTTRSVEEGTSYVPIDALCSSNDSELDQRSLLHRSLHQLSRPPRLPSNIIFPNPAKPLLGIFRKAPYVFLS